MAGLAFENQDFFVLKNPKAEIEPGTLRQRGPEFNGQDIVVAGRGFIAQMTFDDGEKGVLGLQFEQGSAEMPEKLAPGRFEDIEISRIIDMVADGAIGVNHAINMAKRGGHGGHCICGRRAPPCQKAAISRGKRLANVEFKKSLVARSAFKIILRPWIGSRSYR